MTTEFVPASYPTVDAAERAAANVAHVAVEARQRLAVLRHWLLTLPDEHISDEARRDGLSVIAGEPEPGRDRH